MPTPLTPQEQVVLQQDTNYLSLNIPVLTSTVINWGGRSILIFSSQNDGYFTTDISDLGPTVISQLQNESTPQSTAWGMIYNLPQAVSDTISSEAQTALDAAKAAGNATAGIAAAIAAAIGDALNKLLGPIVSALLPVLLLAGLIFFMMYKPKGPKEG